MKQTILGMDKDSFVKKINFRKRLIVSALFGAVLLNVLFTFLRNDRNHGLMLFLNIFVDALGGWFAISYHSFRISPPKKLLRIYEAKRSMLRGKVVEISEETYTIQSIPCRRVVVEGNGQQVLFLPENGAITLNVGESWTFSLASGLVVEVET